MPFTAHDLRYHAEQHYQALYNFLLQRAKRYLESLKFNVVEQDIVVGHVIEQLVRLGVLGGGDHTLETALDRMSQAQFYSFLNHSIRNKSIDRLRKHRLSISTFSELESPSDDESADDPLNDIVEPIWGAPFATPEEATLRLMSQEELRSLLKHCIEMLHDAPHQLQAVIQELGTIEATNLLNILLQDLGKDNPATKTDAPLPNASQHKDHAHKKIRNCLQKSSTNLAVMIALRLTKYGVPSTGSHDVLVEVKALVGDDLSEHEIELGLKHLVHRGILDWHGESQIRLTNADIKRLARFYEA